MLPESHVPTTETGATLPAYELVVGIREQLMHVIRLSDGAVSATYPVSTARNGVGSEEGSGKTPLGHFLIRECIGDGMPSGTLFQSRKPVGSWPDNLPNGLTEESDMILGRILWLDGIDPDNANTHSRYIYIHGTNQIDLLGTPASHGCIRMHPQDVVNLFNLVCPGTRVLIGLAGR